MGDRSYGGFDVLKKDEAKAKEIIEPDDVDDHEIDRGVEAIRMEVTESTGGGYEAADELREAGIPFWWDWEACLGAYEAGQIVFIPGDGEADAFPEGPHAKVNSDGEVDEESLVKAREFIRLRDKFIALARG